MQVNAKLEEKDKALQNVSQTNILIIRQTKKYSALLLDCAKNEFHLVISIY